MSIRILSYNIHKGVGWTSRRSTLPVIQTKLHELNHDILFLQEVRGIQFEIFNSGIWPHCSYGKNAIYINGDHGNAILSKFPIVYTNNIDLSEHRMERRGLLHVIVNVPFTLTRQLHLLCVHLGLFENDRRKQLAKIINYIELTIPENEIFILGGDFNDWGNYATTPLVKNMRLKEVFLETQNKYARTFPAWAPVFRLDRIYLHGFHIESANRLMLKPWRLLSDHIAIEATLNPIKNNEE